MEENARAPFEKIQTPFSWRLIWLVVGIFLMLFAIASIATFAYTAAYKNKVLPGVSVGSVVVGGMQRDELVHFLNAMNDKLANDGITITFVDGQQTYPLKMYPVLVIDGDANGDGIDLIYMDVNAAADDLMNYGKQGNLFLRTYTVLRSKVSQPRLVIDHVTVDTEKVLRIMNEFVSSHSTQAKNAGVVVTSIDPLVYEITTSSPGIVFAYEDVPAKLKNAWAELSVPDLRVVAQREEPTVVEEDVAVIAKAELSQIFDQGAFVFIYENPQTKLKKQWTVLPQAFVPWIVVQSDENHTARFAFDGELVRSYLQENIATMVEKMPRDAIFKTDEQGKVIEFQVSQNGVALNEDATIEALQHTLQDRIQKNANAEKEISLVLDVVEPDITTAEVNDLGIIEILGVGVSTFAGSPKNRIHNIANGVKKLNGILIGSGEEFSAIEYTKPYTEEGGYLPELVIKGNEIKPEIGGGLCQLGTTLFRMAMNSGMEITQRRNHSLVVSYYNDPTNGNPGTDATIYEPQPDFRFKNDTAHSVLVQTDIDYANGQLVFTLWGTGDGRKASYTAPEVVRWIPHGEPQIIETSTMAPGEKNCQKAYRGAEASFTYTRIFSDGKQEDTLFESYYRPLPQICLVGSTQETDTPEEQTAVGQNQFNPDGSVIIPE